MLSSNPIITYQKIVQLPIEIYVRKPSQFIIKNTVKLLPDWTSLPGSIIIVLLYSQIPIETVNQEVEREKQRLKQEFLQFGNQLKLILQKEKYLIELIDPQEGKPMNTEEGSIRFDIVATIHQLLGFTFRNTDKGCKMLDHPAQKTAIYPSILLSDVSPKLIDSILRTYF